VRAHASIIASPWLRANGDSTLSHGLTTCHTMFSRAASC
jgi:hypothetical protein